MQMLIPSHMAIFNHESWAANPEKATLLLFLSFSTNYNKTLVLADASRLKKFSTASNALLP